MKPALRNLIEVGRGGDEVAVIVRLEHAGVTPPPEVRVVARFGPVLTVRCPRRAVTGLVGARGVRSVSAPRLYGPDVVVADESAPDLDVRPQDERRPAGPTATGRGVVVGIIDWGLDLAHPAVRRRADGQGADGGSRVLALWNQVPGPDPALPNRYGYGRIHDATAIDAALASPDPYRALRYDPALSDLGRGSHGMVTTSIAAGSDFDGGVPGVAPDADVVFVHLSTWGDEGLGGLGDSVALLEGLDFIREVAGSRPLVVNLSMGTIEGPGDGSTHVEQAIDAMILERPGRAVVESCGNYFQNSTHTAGRLAAGQQVRLPVLVQAVHRASRHEIDVWYPATDRVTVGIIAPDGRARVLSRPGQDRRLRAGGADVARIIHRLADPDNGRNEAMIWLGPHAPAGTWAVVLTAVDVPDGSYHVFIGREALDPRGHTQFPGDVAVSTTTTGSICNGLHTVTVGAYNAHDDDRPVTDFSSSGPTAWVGLARPHLLAPGWRVLAARSRAKNAAPGETPLATRMSGTSMAAPHVTGTIACQFQAARQPLTVSEYRRALLVSCAQYEGSDTDRAGSGYLDTASAIAEAAQPGTMTARARTAAAGSGTEAAAPDATADLPGSAGEQGAPSEPPNQAPVEANRPATTLASRRFTGDADLQAVIEGRLRLGAPGTPASPAPVRSTGPAIVRVQQALIDLGYPLPRSGADGRVGPETEAAVARYKADHRIVPGDPVVGPQTLAALDADVIALDGPPPAPPAPPAPINSQLLQRLNPQYDEAPAARVMSPAGQARWPGSHFGDPIARVQTITAHFTAGWPRRDAAAGFVARYIVPGTGDRGIGPQLYISGDGTVARLIDLLRLTWHAEWINGFSLGVETGNLGDVAAPPNAQWVQASADTEDIPGAKLWITSRRPAQTEVMPAWWTTATYHGPGRGAIGTGNMLFGEQVMQAWALLARYLMAELGLPRNVPLLPHELRSTMIDGVNADKFRRTVMADERAEMVQRLVGVPPINIAPVNFTPANAAALTAQYGAAIRATVPNVIQRNNPAWHAWCQAYRGLHGHGYTGSLGFDPVNHHPHAEHDCPGPLFDFHRLAREISDYWWYPFDVAAGSTATPRRPYRSFDADTPVLEYYFDEDEALRTAQITAGIHGAISSPETFRLDSRSPVYAMSNGELVAARFPDPSAGVSQAFLLVRHEVYQARAFPSVAVAGAPPLPDTIDYDQPPQSVYTLYMHLGRPAGLSFDTTADDNPDWLNRALLRKKECDLGVGFYDGNAAHHGIAANVWANRPPGVPRRPTTLEGWRNDQTVLAAFLNALSTGGIALIPRQGMAVPVRILLGDFLGESGVIHRVLGTVRHGIRVETFAPSFIAPTFTGGSSAAGWSPPSSPPTQHVLEYQSEWSQVPTNDQRTSLTAIGVDPDLITWWPVVAQAQHINGTLPAGDRLPLDGFVQHYRPLEFAKWLNGVTWASEWPKFQVTDAASNPVLRPARPRSRRV